MTDAEIMIYLRQMRTLDLFKCLTFGLFSQLEDNKVPVGKIYETIVNSKCWKGNTAAPEFLDDHQYESICSNCDPIYEEINEKPPPLPISSPPGNLILIIKLT